MENASKALILSGAVLVAIIIISLGVYIISSQKEAIGGSEETAKTLEVKTHNETFEKYQGTKRGSDVRNLLNDVKIYNNRNASNTISITYSTESNIDTIYSSIKPYGTYKVSIPSSGGYDANGYVIAITISD